MGNSRNIWLFGRKTPILKDKQALIDSYFRYMLSRTMSMFEYKNLPETIPQRELEMIIQLYRFGIISKVDGKLFVFFGGLGGEPNEYYQPTSAIVSNPYLKYSDTLKLDDYIKDDSDAVIIWNDSAHIGLYPMFEKNSELLADCDLTMRYVLINQRFMNILTADDSDTADNLRDMFDKVDNGKEFGIVVTTSLMEESSIDKVETASSKNSNPLKDIIECKQYILGSWYNELGLNALFNMKRESINESESAMNEDALLPLIDDMLKCRKLAVEKVNAKFGTNIEVDLSSSWKKVRENIDLKEKQIESEIVNDENSRETATTSGDGE